MLDAAVLRPRNSPPQAELHKIKTMSAWQTDVLEADLHRVRIDPTSELLSVGLSFLGFVKVNIIPADSASDQCS